MKALIIENEYDVPDELKQFLKDNPTLFESVDEQCFCQHRTLEELAEYIRKVDAIIVMSTFMYKDQLEEYVTALASGRLGSKKIYGWYILTRLQEWNQKRENGSYEESFYFYHFEPFLAGVKKLVTEGEVYSIEKDYDEPTRAVRVHYSPEKDEFYEA